MPIKAGIQTCSSQPVSGNGSIVNHLSAASKRKRNKASSIYFVGSASSPLLHRCVCNVQNPQFRQGWERGGGKEMLLPLTLVQKQHDNDAFPLSFKS